MGQTQEENMQRFSTGFFIATLCVVVSSSGIARARSLAGYCSNWMTISAADQETGKHSESATRAGCAALQKSGDFKADYIQGACLVCDLSDWTPAVGGVIAAGTNIVAGTYVLVTKGVGFWKRDPTYPKTIGSVLRVSGFENARISFSKKNKSEYIGRPKTAYTAYVKAELLKQSQKSCKNRYNRRQRWRPPIWGTGPEIELYGPLSAANVASWECAKKERLVREVICNGWTNTDVTFAQLPPACRVR